MPSIRLITRNHYASKAQTIWIIWRRFENKQRLQLLANFEKCLLNSQTNDSIKVLFCALQREWFQIDCTLCNSGLNSGERFHIKVQSVTWLPSLQAGNCQVKHFDWNLIDFVTPSWSSYNRTCVLSGRARVQVMSIKTCVLFLPVSEEQNFGLRWYFYWK